jgi:hypothetical protein
VISASISARVSVSSPRRFAPAQAFSSQSGGGAAVRVKSWMPSRCSPACFPSVGAPFGGAAENDDAGAARSSGGDRGFVLAHRDQSTT